MNFFTTKTSLAAAAWLCLLAGARADGDNSAHGGSLPANATSATVADVQPASAPAAVIPLGKSLRLHTADGLWQLQTAVHHYEDANGRKLTLAGAMHVGLAEYYENLNKLFADYDCVLFEMVGGEHLTEDLRMQQQGKRPPLREEQLEFAGKNFLTSAVLHYVMQAMSERYGLVIQNEMIDYAAENMLHADVSFKELSAMQQQQNISSLEELMSMSFSANPQNLFYMLLAEIMGDEAAAVRMSMLSSVQQVEKLGDLKSGVVLFGRNRKCFAVLDQQLKKSLQSICIFYGAAHLPDMHKLALERGFVYKNSDYLTAWQVAAPPAVAVPAKN